MNPFVLLFLLANKSIFQYIVSYCVNISNDIARDYLHVPKIPRWQYLL